jgi:hypothetical protein
VNRETGEPLTEIYRALNGAAPLFYKLGESVAGGEAQIFLEAMQGFFNSGNLLTDGTDRDLRAGTDNLLRVLAGAGLHPDYRLGKLATARESFESYRRRVALGGELPTICRDSSIAENMQRLNASLLSLLEGSHDLDGLNGLVLRLNVTLAEYGMSLDSAENGYPALPSSLHNALRDFVSAAISINLNAQLPDNLDRVLTGHLRTYGQPAWERMKNKPTLRSCIASVWRRLLR